MAALQDLDQAAQVVLRVEERGGGVPRARRTVSMRVCTPTRSVAKKNAPMCHFPPGTSKWNKIEHRLFSAISQNWRGKPLVSHEVIVKLIAATTTRTGLRVRSELDTNAYAAGLTVSDAEMETLYLRPDPYHGEWNYSLFPRLMLPQE